MSTNLPSSPELPTPTEPPCGVALLLIDVINDLDFTEGEQLLEFAIPMAERIASLKSRATACGLPIIYANDNFGRWRSDLPALVRHCGRAESRGRPLVERLAPKPDDYFVLKPRHSAFYCTSLDVLLSQLSVHTLILTGLAGNICVLFTAHDAYLREYSLIVPRDGVASNTAEENSTSLSQMERILKAETSPVDHLTASRLRQLAKLQRPSS